MAQWVSPLLPLWWKERANSGELSSDSHVHTVGCFVYVCAHAYILCVCVCVKKYTLEE